MIRVYADHKGARYRLFVEGHAGYAAGEDVVCAGVSALVGALVAYAAASPDCHHLRWSTRSGEVFLSCRGGLGAGFDVVLKGLCEIAARYPAHVTIVNGAEKAPMPRKRQNAAERVDRNGRKQ